MSNSLETSRIEPISLQDAAEVAGGMMKLPLKDTTPVDKLGDTGWTWGTVTDLPASEGVGIVIHF